MQGSVAAAGRLVRAVTRPYPGAFVDNSGTRTIVWRAAIDDQQSDPDTPRLRFSDGTLILLDWETGPVTEAP
jgi:methionyl-tRNA formyltransferase